MRVCKKPAVMMRPLAHSITRLSSRVQRSDRTALHTGRKQYARSVSCWPLDIHPFTQMEIQFSESSLSSTHRPTARRSCTECTIRFHDHAEALNVSADALYNALLADAEIQPLNWDLQGRQTNIWKKIGRSVALGVGQSLT